MPNQRLDVDIGSGMYAPPYPILLDEHHIMVGRVSSVYMCVLIRALTAREWRLSILLFAIKITIS